MCVWPTHPFLQPGLSKHKLLHFKLSCCHPFHLQMRQNASGGQVRLSLPNGPTTNSLPSPNPSLHPTRPLLGPHRPLCPPQPLANGPMGPGPHGHSESLPVGSNSSSNNQSGPTATGPNGDVPYLQAAGSGDAALLPHTCTSTQTQDTTPRQALHLNSSQVRPHLLFVFYMYRSSPFGKFTAAQIRYEYKSVLSYWPTWISCKNCQKPLRKSFKWFHETSCEIPPVRHVWIESMQEFMSWLSTRHR